MQIRTFHRPGVKGDQFTKRLVLIRYELISSRKSRANDQISTFVLGDLPFI